MPGDAINVGRLIHALDGTRSLTSAAQLADMTMQTAMGYVRQWHRMGVCHVAGVAGRAGDGRRLVLLYRVGAGQDVRAPFKKPGNPKPWVSAITAGLLLQHLDGLHTLDELEHVTGLTDRVLRRHLAAWRDAGAAFIAGWEDGYVGVLARPMYALRRPTGRPPAEPVRPEKMSNAQRLREYRAKARAMAVNHAFAGSDGFKEAA